LTKGRPVIGDRACGGSGGEGGEGSSAGGGPLTGGASFLHPDENATTTNKATNRRTDRKCKHLFILAPPIRLSLVHILAGIPVVLDIGFILEIVICFTG
jgi:hypothetical protein